MCKIVLHQGVDASKEETKASGASTDKVSQTLQTDLTMRVFVQQYTQVNVLHISATFDLFNEGRD